MSAYGVPTAAAAAHSPHTPFIPASAQAQQGTTTSVYSTNSAAFSSPFADPTKKTGFTPPQQYDAASAADPQTYPHLAAYAGVDVYQHAAAVSNTSAAAQQQKQQEGSAFQPAVVGLSLYSPGPPFVIMVQVLYSQIPVAVYILCCTLCTPHATTPAACCCCICCFVCCCICCCVLCCAALCCCC